MDQDLKKNEAEQKKDLKKNEAEQKQPEGQKTGGKMKKRLMIVGAAVVVIVGAFVGMNQSRETNRRIENLIDDLQYRADAYHFSYPVIGGQPDDGSVRTGTDDIYWGEDGYFGQVKNKNKFSAAVADAMETACIYADNEGEEAKFHSDGFEKACRMAAVLEYVNYENADVKAVMDSLMAQAAEAAKGDNWITSKNIFKTFAEYSSLPYYGNTDAIPKEEIEAAFAEKWQEIKQEMYTEEADLDGFLKDASEVASVAPIEIPEYGTVKGTSAAGTEAAPAGSAPAIDEMYLDMNKMVPYDEMIAALEEYGEEAIFRNGAGGYYDGSREKGNLYGDFRTQYVSGKVRRTGNEDAFTEQYLRDHYDKPSKTYTYFKDEMIGALPTFYTDTERVFVYDGSVYAFAPYAIYTVDGAAIYDLDAAKEAEKKHLPLSEADALMGDVRDKVQPFLRVLSDFAPRYEYDTANNLITVYLKAPKGTAEALKGNGQILIKENTKMTWEDLQEYLCEVCKEMSSTMGNIDDIRSAMWGTQETGVGFVLTSDADSESRLLSILNGEVVQDNSKNSSANGNASEKKAQD